MKAQYMIMANGSNKELFGLYNYLVFATQKNSSYWSRCRTKFCSCRWVYRWASHLVFWNRAYRIDPFPSTNTYQKSCWCILSTIGIWVRFLLTWSTLFYLFNTSFHELLICFRISDWSSVLTDIDTISKSSTGTA